MARKDDSVRRTELERLRDREAEDLNVESKKGSRPLEGLSGSGAGTTWTEPITESAPITSR
jgi:hypothetical protein